MYVSIDVEVKDHNKEKHIITLDVMDIEEMAIAKAKEKGMRGYNGRVFEHFDEHIEKVVVKY